MDSSVATPFKRSNTGHVESRVQHARRGPGSEKQDGPIARLSRGNRYRT